MSGHHRAQHRHGIFFFFFFVVVVIAAAESLPFASSVVFIGPLEQIGFFRIFF